MLLQVFNRLRNFLMRPIGLADAMVALGFVVLLVQLPEHFAADPGVGWHLATGKWIVEHASIPYLDPFLAYKEGRSWVSDQWLSDCLFYLLFRAGSWPLLYAALLSIIALTYFLLLRSALSALVRSYLITCFVVIVAFKLGQLHFILRPVVFSFLFFSVLYVLLYRLYFEIKAERQPRFARLFVCLPLMFMLWANMHPGFVTGLVLILLLIVALFLDQLLLGVGFSRATLKKLSALFLLCCLATLLNPYGYNLHRSIVALGSSDYFMNLHMEWKGIEFKEFAGFLFETVLILIVLSTFLAGVGSMGWRCFEVFSLLAFAHLALQAIRMLPFFGIVMTVPFVQALLNLGAARFMQKNKIWSRLAPYFENLALREQRTNAGKLVLLVGVAMLLFQAASSGRIPFFAGQFGPPQKDFPYQAVQFLKAQGQELRVAASPDWGGFITWFGAGQLKPILDDRNTLVGEAFYRRFMASMKPGADWRSYLSEFGVTHLLLSKASPLGASIRETSTLDILYQDEVAIVFKYESK